MAHAMFTSSTGPAPERSTGRRSMASCALLACRISTSFAGGMAMVRTVPSFDTSRGGAGAEVVTESNSTALDGADDLRKMTDILGTPPDYTEKGRQLASVEIQLSGGPRPFAVEGLKSRFLQNISGSALAGATSPSSRAVSTRNVTYSIGEGLGLSADRLNRPPVASAGLKVRGSMGPFGARAV